MTESILPAGLGEWAALGLVALSFLTSLITATFSLGGGSLMIIAMTLVKAGGNLLRPCPAHGRGGDDVVAAAGCHGFRKPVRAASMASGASVIS